jgi:ADP-heptose:LPS heptosyltransferase
MPRDNFFSNIITNILKSFLSLEENKSTDLGSPKKFIIIRQHNQLGDLLSGVSLLRAIKETYPESEITLVLSPVNFQGLIKNKYIDRLFIFDKSKLIKPSYLSDLMKLLKENYDVAIVPVVVSISFTSNLLARLANAKIRIGPSSLDGQINKNDYLFDRRVKIELAKDPDSNVAERTLEIVRPFGITTNSYISEISYDEQDIKAASDFIQTLNAGKKDYIIGLHTGAGKSPNRWSLLKYIELLIKISSTYPVKFYLTGTSKDKEENDFVKSKSSLISGEFVNMPIPEVAALIAKSDLFICNDTGIMHVAGATKTPQISLFGPTNPFNWAPVGSNKHFIKRSEFIDDITVDDVFEICGRYLKPEGKLG